MQEMEIKRSIYWLNILEKEEKLREKTDPRYRLQRLMNRRENSVKKAMASSLKKKKSKPLRMNSIKKSSKQIYDDYKIIKEPPNVEEFLSKVCSLKEHLEAQFHRKKELDHKSGRRPMSVLKSRNGPSYLKTEQNNFLTSVEESSPNWKFRVSAAEKFILDYERRNNDYSRRSREKEWASCEWPQRSEG